MTEGFPKPRYEPPILIDLGSMAKGRGICSTGNGDAVGYCTDGNSNTFNAGYCSSGWGNNGTYCTTGDIVLNSPGGCETGNVHT